MGQEKIAAAFPVGADLKMLQYVLEVTVKAGIAMPDSSFP